MLKADRIWSLFTRSSIESRMTASSQANSTSRFEAIITKFCDVLLSNMPCIRAKVMVVVAMMMALCFFLKSSVLKRLGNMNLKNS